MKIWVVSKQWAAGRTELHAFSTEQAAREYALGAMGYEATFIGIHELPLDGQVQQ